MSVIHEIISAFKNYDIYVKGIILLVFSLGWFTIKSVAKYPILFLIGFLWLISSGILWFILFI